MGFTIFPDMENKRKKQSQRKQHRQQKKDEKLFEKRRRYINKKESFWAVFFKCFIVVFVISTLVAVGATYAVRKNKVEEAKNKYSQWIMRLYNAFDSARMKIEEKGYSKEEALEVLKGELKLEMINGNYPSLYDFSAVVYDSEGNILCDSSEAVCFFEHENIVNIGKIYISSKETFGDLYDDLERWTAEEYRTGKPSRIWLMEDFYVSDKDIVPGVMYVYEGEYGGLLQSTKVKYDFTPKDTTGYAYYITKEESTKRINGEECFDMGYIFGGTREESCAYKDTRSGVIKKFDNGNLGIDWDNNVKPEKYERFSLDEYNDLSSRLIDFDCLGEKYLLVSSGYYFFYRYYFAELVKIYLAVFAGVIIVSMIVARFRWTRIKMQNEVEEYRKTITDAMAHDLKSPLMAVAVTAENLKNNVHTEKKDYYADVIAENVAYMNENIEHILQLSRSEEAIIKPVKEDIELEDVVDNIIAKYGAMLDEKGLDINCNVSLVIKGDNQLITEAIDNLINNAIKYGEPGKVINIFTDKNTLIITNECKNAENIDVCEITKPFTKADKSRSNKSGSGLGLAISKNILAGHGFKLVLEAKDNVFTVKVIF